MEHEVGVTEAKAPSLTTRVQSLTMKDLLFVIGLAKEALLLCRVALAIFSVGFPVECA